MMYDNVYVEIMVVFFEQSNHFVEDESLVQQCHYIVWRPADEKVAVDYYYVNFFLGICRIHHHHS